MLGIFSSSQRLMAKSYLVQNIGQLCLWELLAQWESQVLICYTNEWSHSTRTVKEAQGISRVMLDSLLLMPAGPGE